MKNNKYMQWALATGVAASLFTAIPAFALSLHSGLGLGLGLGVNGNGNEHAQEAKVIAQNGTNIKVNADLNDTSDGNAENENNEADEHASASSTVKVHIPFFPILPIHGNGEPVIAGQVTATNGNTITVTNASNITYTIDATDSAVVKKGSTTTITNVIAGDNVIVQGTVNGTAIHASSIIDAGMTGQVSTSTATSTTNDNVHGNAHMNFFAAIGVFFKNLFGF